MALLIRGKTICSLCSRTIDEDDEVFGVPPLISNQLDPLFRYSDGMFHLECANGNPEFEQVGELIALWEQRSANKVSFLSGNPITSPDDFFAFPYLGAEDQFAELNFRVYSKDDLSEWTELPGIVEKLKELRNSNTWESPILGDLIEQLETLVA